MLTNESYLVNFEWIFKNGVRDKLMASVSQTNTKGYSLVTILDDEEARYLYSMLTNEEV